MNYIADLNQILQNNETYSITLVSLKRLTVFGFFLWVFWGRISRELVGTAFFAVTLSHSVLLVTHRPTWALCESNSHRLVFLPGSGPGEWDLTSYLCLHVLVFPEISCCWVALHLSFLMISGLVMTLQFTLSSFRMEPMFFPDFCSLELQNFWVRTTWKTLYYLL